MHLISKEPGTKIKDETARCISLFAGTRCPIRDVDILKYITNLVNVGAN